jgi:hypothetical protein
MERAWNAKTIGPSLPSFYHDDHRLPSNKAYGFNSFISSDAASMTLAMAGRAASMFGCPCILWDRLQP